jgi:CubicO group peptidase (beta-lactamase class C family)
MMTRLKATGIASVILLSTISVRAQAPRESDSKQISVQSRAALDSKIKSIDAMAAADFKRHPIGSMTIGIIAQDRLLWTKSYGYADMGKKALADSDTVYRIGSVTKMFTTLMFEQLIALGKVHLDDLAETYFPEIKEVQGRFAYAPPVSLFQLATHTSGLGSEPDDLDTYVKGPVAAWQTTLIAAVPHVHYQVEPGTQYLYSNVGYAILGAALSRAAAQPYLDYIPEHIFAPLGMNHTALLLSSALLPDLAKGYQLNGDKSDTETPTRELAGRGYKVPNGAAYTTVGDLARFASFLMGYGPDSVLKASTLKHFQTDTAVASDLAFGDGYGLAGIVIRRPTYTALGHDGDVAGYQAALYINKDVAIGVVVLANSAGDGVLDSDAVALNALDLLSTKPKQ